MFGVCRIHRYFSLAFGGGGIYGYGNDPNHPDYKGLV